jgi:SAM-dependent methyltransferase
LPEFTGERVIPNQVDPDLWNEHLARYLFAARLSSRKRVLDIACGTGYGTAELAATAAVATGVDVSTEAVAYARAHHSRPNNRFLCADARQLPFRDGSVDLVAAFEVIEHLADWPALLAEARRVLAPSGQLLVSTPNRAYYAEARRLAGPNPFHAHEFDFDEFEAALRGYFPHVTLWVQNHAAAVVFRSLSPGSAELRMEPGSPDPSTSHFFLAVCALAPQLGAPTFVYLPSSANVLREREQHIARLEGELGQKDRWLADSQAAHAALVEEHRRQTAELEARNRWADQLNSELARANNRIVEVQDELAAEQSSARDTAQAYESELAALNLELAKRTQWARDTEARLTGEVQAVGTQLGESNRLLQQAEQTVEERTQWALRLQSEVDGAQAQLNGYLASRWVRLGHSLGLGPKRPA